MRYRRGALPATLHLKNHGGRVRGPDVHELVVDLDGPPGEDGDVGVGVGEGSDLVVDVAVELVELLGVLGAEVVEGVADEAVNGHADGGEPGDGHGNTSSSTGFSILPGGGSLVGSPSRWTLKSHRASSRIAVLM